MLAACIASRLRETDRHEPERRSGPRYLVDLLPPIRLLVRPSFQALHANVRDVSLKGLGIICDRPLQPGAIVAIQLQRRHAGVSGILSGTAVHCSPVSEGLWRCGCRLSRMLTDDELYSLLIVSSR